MKTFVLYGLRRPDDKRIRYWGITSRPITLRLRAHRTRKGDNPHKSNWFNKANAEGAPPEIVPFMEGLTKEEACEAEIQVIKFLRAAGHDLLNMSSGGEASRSGIRFTMPESTKIKISVALTGRKESPEQIEAKRLRMLGKNRSIESRIKQGNTNRGRKDSEEIRLKKSKSSIGNVRALGTKQSGASSKFLGVSWYPPSGKWRARIRVSKKAIHLGHFSSEEDAAKAYDVAARKYFGDSTKLNFPC